MTAQSFENHVRYVPLFHFVLMPALLLGVIGSFVNLWQSIGDHQRLYSASLIVLLMVALVMVALYARGFAVKAQDRAIRAEENLRHYVLTGRLLDPRLTVPQIVGLRFASDDEFVALARKAAESGLSQKGIKKAVTRWRADEHRV
jgi:integral membrane sensor domain MASE1